MINIMEKLREKATPGAPADGAEAACEIAAESVTEPTKKRGIFGKGKNPPDDFNIDEGSTTILDVLSPTSIDLTGRDYIIVDGVYHAYLYITGYGYTTVVGNGWLSSLVEAGEGVGLNFII
jgi:hypothetical protein